MACIIDAARRHSELAIEQEARLHHICTRGIFGRRMSPTERQLLDKARTAYGPRLPDADRIGYIAHTMRTTDTNAVYK